jgi:hypothetical protein
MSAAPVLEDLQVVPPARRPRSERHLRLVRSGEELREGGRPVAPSSRREATLRLTRRGRLAVTGAITALLVVTAGGLAGAVMADTEPAVVTVEPGQTLSEIAATTLSGLPLDRAIVEIQIANNLSTSQVQAGQTLVIPSP